MSKTVIIMRGLPGSGKSTYARREHPNAWVVSADYFFVRDGVYRFDATQLGAAHNMCFRSAMAGCQADCPIIVVDNTNTTRAEYTPYVALARAFGYAVELVWVQAPVALCAARNTHGVPLNVIQNMARRFEEPQRQDPTQTIGESTP